MYQNIFLLALCQAMMMTGVSLVLSSSALVGAELAAHPILATLPMSLQYLTTMLVMIPVSRMMQRRGRRPVFVAGALIGAVGMGLATYGIAIGSFVLFAAAGILVGMHNAVGQFYRFAAAEAADSELKSRAISLTLAGGVLAAFLGPNLARLTRDAMVPTFSASFLALCVTTLIAAALASRLRLPVVDDAAAEGTGRPMAEIAKQPAFVVAVAAATLGYASMNLIMTATPLAMTCQHQAFDDIAWVIQWHIVAMFAPSFFTGDLIRRVGVLTVIAAGALLELACIAVNLAGTSVAHFNAGLILLGLGWNFLYVGGTSLLTETYRPEERGRVQGLNDTLVFTSVTLSSLAAGGLVNLYGWETVNLAVIPGMLTVLLLGAGLAWRQRRAGAALVTASE